VVFNGGDFRVEAVIDGNIPGGRSGGHEVGDGLQSIGASIQSVL
jgi:hypothetical protein